MTAKGMYIAAALLFGLGSVLVECTDEVKCNQWSQACLFERSTTVPSRPSKSEGHEARCLRLGASHQSTVLSFGRSTTFATVQLIECIPLLRVTQYEQGGSGNYLPDSEWNCQLLQSTPAAMGMSGRIVKLEDIYNLPKGTVHQFQSGISVLKIPQVKKPSRSRRVQPLQSKQTKQMLTMTSLLSLPTLRRRFSS
jgi:hypothetical protein